MKHTPNERINYAMNLQKPDRIPLMCQFSIGSMLQQLQPNPVEFWYDKNIFADGLITLCKEFRFDGILVSLHGHSNNWKDILVKREQMVKASFQQVDVAYSLSITQVFLQQSWFCIRSSQHFQAVTLLNTGV